MGYVMDEAIEPEDETDYSVECMGVDRLKHRYLPHKNETLCGANIWKKKISDKDRETYMSCYECTY